MGDVSSTTKNASPREALVEYLKAHDVLERIITDGFCEVPWKNVSSAVRRIKRGYWRLLDRDPRRQLFEIPEREYARDELGNPLEIGLLDKRKGEHKTSLSALEIAEGRKQYDGNKCVFHYNEDLLARLRKQTGLVDDYGDMLGATAMLNIDGFHLARAVATLFDEANMLHEEHERYPRSFSACMQESLAVTRLLRYERLRGRTPDALPHRDRCALTVHWISSHRGLGLFNRKRELLEANECDPGKILIFPGQKFWGLTRGRYGTGTLHGVRDKRRGEGLRLSRAHRFVAVTFVHVALDPATVKWMNDHADDLRINPDEYRL